MLASLFLPTHALRNEPDELACKPRKTGRDLRTRLLQRSSHSAQKCSVAEPSHFTEVTCLWPNSLDRYEQKAQFIWFKYSLYSALLPACTPVRWGHGVFQHPPAWCWDLAVAARGCWWKRVRLSHVRQTPDSRPEHTSALGSAWANRLIGSRWIHLWKESNNI